MTHNDNQENITERLIEASQQRRRQRSSVRRDRFVKGPIELPWLTLAAELPGKAINIGLAIWYMAGLTGRDVDLAVGDKLARQFGVSRNARYRALTALESVGLITTERRPGRGARISLKRTRREGHRP